MFCNENDFYKSEKKSVCIYIFKKNKNNLVLLRFYILLSSHYTVICRENENDK